MKKRIGWLNNKPIIQGDKNLKNSNELHIDELSSNNSEGGGNNISEELIYYKTTQEQVNTQNIPMLGQILPIIEYIHRPDINKDDTNICNPQSLLYVNYGDGRHIVGFAASIKKQTLKIYGMFITMHGNAEERWADIAFALKELGTGDGDIANMEQGIMNPFRDYCTQITKEEYESLITIKPIE